MCSKVSPPSSAASPQVAGVAVLVASLLRRSTTYLMPDQMRDLMKAQTIKLEELVGKWNTTTVTINPKGTLDLAGHSASFANLVLGATGVGGGRCSRPDPPAGGLVAARSSDR